MTFEEMKAKYMKQLSVCGGTVQLIRKEEPVKKEIDNLEIVVKAGITQTEKPNSNIPEIKLPASSGRGSTCDDFDRYTGTGYIRVNVYSANQKNAISNAKVTISKYNGTEPILFVETITDASGNTPVISVPAPPKEVSDNSKEEILPYGVYNIVVSSEEYRSVPIFNVSVFPDVVSVQPVEMNLLF
ncbi:MAG: hypothetical protein DBX47_05635 [Clostridiales bacterium]|nr:MAG: hypothetical protein DBX47_05635 [Clostridiales bacterium]